MALQRWGEGRDSCAHCWPSPQVLVPTQLCCGLVCPARHRWGQVRAHRGTLGGRAGHSPREPTHQPADLALDQATTEVPPKGLGTVRGRTGLAGGGRPWGGCSSRPVPPQPRHIPGRGCSSRPVPSPPQPCHSRKEVQVPEKQNHSKKTGRPRAPGRASHRAGVELAPCF